METSAFDVKENEVENWCRYSMEDDYSSPAKPLELSHDVQKPGIHVLASPPAAAALIVLKKVAKAHHKQPRDMTYVTLIPRLVSQEVRRSCFQKKVDLWFSLSTEKFWPHSAFELILVGISFPLHRT